MTHDPDDGLEAIDDTPRLGAREPLVIGRAGRRSAARSEVPGRESHAAGRNGAGGGEGRGAPLAAAGFLALLRDGSLAHTGSWELRAGQVRARRLLSGPQAEVVAALRAALQGVVRSELLPAVVRARPLVRLGADEVLRPELALIATAAPAPDSHEAVGHERFGDAGATPRSVLLAVEVARGASARLAAYAGAGVREVWVLDLERTWTEAYRSPWRGVFTSRTLWYAGEEVPLGALPGVAVQALALG